MKNQILLFAFAIVFLVFTTQCKKESDKDAGTKSPSLSSIENTLAFGALNKVKGIWNGPVTSTTPLGGFSEWIVDFRPLSENQISSKNELDIENDIHMSFFIAKYKGEYRLCFRNGGMFGGRTRTSYFLADSVRETSTESYYRFSEIVKGESRAFTELSFKGNTMLLKSYTNAYNTLNKPSLHMTWSATLQDSTTCKDAVAQFSFPKKTLTKDFTNAFEGHNEAIYYSATGGDPFPENEDAYLGEANISYSFSSAFSPSANEKVLLIISAQPLIDGFQINMDNLRFRSRYILLAANDLDFTFASMHPGDYYLYALYDADGNGTYSSGDGVSTSNVAFTLAKGASVSATTQINFQIP